MHKMWKILFISILTLVFSISVFFRFFKLGDVPNGLYWDETAMLVDAQSIAETGKDMHGRPWYQVIYPSYGDYKSPVYIWMAGTSVRVFGSNNFALRLPSAISGLLTVVVAGLIVRTAISLESNKKVDSFFLHTLTVATSLIVAISPWSILFSRTGFEAHLGQLFLAISILFLLLSKKNCFFAFLSPIFGLLATYSYFSVRFVWVGIYFLIVILFFILPIQNKLKTKKVSYTFLKRILKYILAFFIFSIGLWPMTHSPLFEESNSFRLSTNSVLQNSTEIVLSNVFREQAGNTKLDRIVFHRWILTGKKLLANYSDNMSLNYLFVSGDPNLRHGTGQHGLFFLVFLPFFIIGFFTFFKRYPKTLLLFSFWWIIALLPASVPNTTPHALRSLNALVPLAAIIGLGLTVSFQKVLTFSILKLRISVSVFFIFLLVSLLQFGHFYFFVYPILSFSFWQGGFEELAKATFSSRTQKESVYVLNFDDRFYLWLLAYGSYSSEKIQLFLHNDFQIRDFDDIFTEHIPTVLATNAIVVGTSDQIESFVKKEQYQIISSQKIMRKNQNSLEIAKVIKNQK